MLTWIIGIGFSDWNSPTTARSGGRASFHLCGESSRSGLAGSRVQSLRRGNLVVTADALADRGVAAIAAEIGELGNYYVSLDIDGLDPSIAPGTESPEAEGLTFRGAKTLLRMLGRQGKLVGADIVEVNPYLDHAELTQHVAVQLLIETLASGYCERPLEIGVRSN